MQEQSSYIVTAGFYDLTYGPLAPEDLQFYEDLAQRLKGPVLELGCGTGRVGLHLARAGFEVVGLDLSPAMLAQYASKLEGEEAAVRKRVTLQQGDMRSSSLSREFALILTPFRSFQHMLGPEDQRQCLENLLAHLAPQGRFVLDVFNPNLEFIVNAQRRGKVWRYDLNVPDQRGGRLMRAFYVEPDTGTQLLQVMFRFEQYDADGVLTGTWVESLPMRWTYRWEAEYLLTLCGLRVEEAYGSYAKAPLNKDAPEMLFVCAKAAG